MAVLAWVSYRMLMNSCQLLVAELCQQVSYSLQIHSFISLPPPVQCWSINC